MHDEALAGRGVAISLTNCYRQTEFGDPIVALKSYVLSPFADEHRMRLGGEPRAGSAHAVDEAGK